MYLYQASKKAYFFAPEEYLSSSCDAGGSKLNPFSIALSFSANINDNISVTLQLFCKIISCACGNAKMENIFNFKLCMLPVRVICVTVCVCVLRDTIGLAWTLHGALHGTLHGTWPCMGSCFLKSLVLTLSFLDRKWQDVLVSWDKIVGTSCSLLKIRSPKSEEPGQP